jgi:hypothetical protein
MEERISKLTTPIEPTKETTVLMVLELLKLPQIVNCDGLRSKIDPLSVSFFHSIKRE